MEGEGEMMTFNQFCHTLTRGDNPVSDFANDFVSDREVGEIGSWDDLETYLFYRNACSGAMEAAQVVWEMYEDNAQEFVRRF
jgi:hypothetical protein